MVELVDPEPYKPKPLNGRQFSQMGLFAQPKPSAEHRWPAGYSPERKAEISEALPAKVGTQPKYKYGLGNNIFMGGADFKKKGGGGSTRQMAKSRGEQARNAIVDVVARSTMPASDLRITPEINVKSIGGAAGHFMSPGVRRSYSRAKGYTIKERTTPTVEVDPAGHSRQAMEHTIIHELGHHADWTNVGPDVFRLRAATRIRGAPPSLEGAAEGYAFKHQRPRRGETLHYPELASYKSLHGVPAFDENFKRVSGQYPQEAVPPPGRVSMPFHQAHLFGRNAETSVTDVERDYGQWGYTDYTKGGERDLGTIRLGRGAPPEAERRIRRGR